MNNLIWWVLFLVGSVKVLVGMKLAKKSAGGVPLIILGALALLVSSAVLEFKRQRAKSEAYTEKHQPPES